MRDYAGDWREIIVINGFAVFSFYRINLRCFNYYDYYYYYHYVLSNPTLLFFFISDAVQIYVKLLLEKEHVHIKSFPSAYQQKAFVVQQLKEMQCTEVAELCWQCHCRITIGPHKT